jgi:hypothetical protein
MKMVGAYVPTVEANTVPYSNGEMIVDPMACNTANPPNKRPTSFELGRRERASELAVGDEAEPKVTSVERMMKPV